MTPTRSAGRRAQLSLEQIVDAAIVMLDREGAAGLTLRGLATELGGGLGSVYWHVAGKSELLDRAGDELVGRALTAAGVGEPGALDDGLPSPPLETALPTTDPVVLEAAATVRRIALALFRQMELHPWLAAQVQLSGADRPNSLQVWEQLGRPLAAMGLTPRQQFNGSTALTGYVVGVGAEMSAQDQVADPTRSKDEQLAELADRWQQPDYDELPWIRSMAEEFSHHDDLAQFAAGLDLLVVGLVGQATARLSG